MMIVGVWLIEPQLSMADLRERVETALLRYHRFRPEGGGGRAGRAVGGRRPLRHRRACGAREARGGAGPGAAGRAQGLRGRPHHATAGPEPPAVAVPPVRGLRDGPLRAGGAHPPLHRGRHRADLGDAVHHRRRQVAARAQAARGRRGGRARLGGGLPAQAGRRSRGQGHRRLRRRSGQGRRDAGRSRRAAVGQHGDGAHRRPGGERPGRHGADARRLAHQPEGQGHAGQARGLGRAAAAVRREGRGTGAGRLDQRRAAGQCGRRHRQLLARQGRGSVGQGDPRHGAGEPAPAGHGVAVGQPLRPRAAGAAHRHRQPHRPPSRPCACA